MIPSLMKRECSLICLRNVSSSTNNLFDILVNPTTHSTIRNFTALAKMTILLMYDAEELRSGLWISLKTPPYST